MEMMELELPRNLENMLLPSPELVNYWRLAENRVYYIDYEIDEFLNEIQRAIVAVNIADRGKKAEDRKPIVLLINSPGGLLCETMSCCQVIKMSRTPVITVNIGQCYSGAALLLLSGHKRYAFPYSIAMIHSGSSGGGYGTYEQQDAAQKIYKKQVDDMGKFILENSRIDEKMFKKKRSQDWYFNIDEQIQYGLADSKICDLDEIFA